MAILSYNQGWWRLFMSEHFSEQGLTITTPVQEAVAIEEGHSETSNSLSLLRVGAVLGATVALAAGIHAEKRYLDTPASAATMKDGCLTTPTLPNTAIYNLLATKRTSVLAQYPSPDVNYPGPCNLDYEQMVPNAAGQAAIPDVKAIKFKIRRNNHPSSIRGTISEQERRFDIIPAEVEVTDSNHQQRAIDFHTSIDGSVLAQQYVEIDLLRKSRHGNKFTVLGKRIVHEFSSGAQPILDEQDPSHPPADPVEPINFAFKLRKAHLSARRFNQLRTAGRMGIGEKRFCEDKGNDPTGADCADEFDTVFRMRRGRRHGNKTSKQQYVNDGRFYPVKDRVKITKPHENSTGPNF
jgi:hypothetical protein